MTDLEQAVIDAAVEWVNEWVNEYPPRPSTRLAAATAAYQHGRPRVVKAIDVQVGDRIRDGVVIGKEPAWQTSHGKPIGVSVQFAVRDDTFPSSTTIPVLRFPQYPPDADVTVAGRP